MCVSKPFRLIAALALVVSIVGGPAAAVAVCEASCAARAREAKRAASHVDGGCCSKGKKEANVPSDSDEHRCGDTCEYCCWGHIKVIDDTHRSVVAERCDGVVATGIHTLHSIDAADRLLRPPLA